MDGNEIVGHVQALITESNQLFSQNDLEKAAAKAEKAYSM